MRQNTIIKTKFMKNYRYLLSEKLEVVEIESNKKENKILM